MRHGNGFSSWWKQERNDDIVTQCNNDINLLEFIKSDDINYYLKMNVYVFIRIEEKNDNEWRTKFFESMGGKSHVRCKRHDFPLVPSHRAKT